MEFTVETPLGQIAAARPASIAVFERLSLDYCCGGRQSLQDACRPAGLDGERVLEEILAAPEGGRVGDPEGVDWTERSLVEFVDHILATHHAYLHENLGPLVELAEKVARAHGDRHVELGEVRDLVAKFAADLDQHLRKEEFILFPSIKQIADRSAPFPIWQPIAVMEAEHDEAGRDLARLRELTDQYVVPEDACSSYRRLMEQLAELEKDTLTHVHKENNILFPRALAALDP